MYVSLYLTIYIDYKIDKGNSSSRRKVLYKIVFLNTSQVEAIHASLVESNIVVIDTSTVERVHRLLKNLK